MRMRRHTEERVEGAGGEEGGGPYAPVVGAGDASLGREELPVQLRGQSPLEKQRAQGGSGDLDARAPRSGARGSVHISPCAASVPRFAWLCLRSS